MMSYVAGQYSDGTCSEKEPNHARNNKSGKRRKSRRVLM